MKKVLPRVAALLLCCALLLPAFPIKQAAAVGGDGVATYRALLIGNAAYDGGQSLKAPPYDVEHMEQLLLQQDFDGSKFAPENIIKLNNATKLQILETIKRQLAAVADGDDVTYFYYSGHGTFDGKTSYIVGVEMGLIGIDELKTALDAVQGRKVVIIDSCYSGGFTGKSAGAAEPARPVMKNTAETQPTQVETTSDELEQYQAGILKPFMGQPGKAQRALTTSSYKVLSAASDFQYSYEYQFNSGSGAACYGPEFMMNGKDYAGGTRNYSGEFTGMLVAGAGCVSFNDVFPEIRALADADRDRSVTLDELYRYLRGAVLYSTVQVYPEGDRTAIFEHSAEENPGWGQPALQVDNNGGPLAPDAESPVRFSLLCSQGWTPEIAIKRSLKVGDNRYADNADANIGKIADVSASGNLPDGTTTALFWDGAAADGSPAGDGWYFAELSTGTYKYPPVPFELRRGVGNFPGSAALPANKPFTANLPGAGSKLLYSFTPQTDGLLELTSTNGSEGMNPEAELFDADGDSLAWSGDQYDGDVIDYNFKILRYLKAGNTYYISVDLSDGSGASVAIASRYITPSADDTPVSVDASRTSYTLFRPDVSGQWTIEAKSKIDDDETGVTLYDTWMSPVAYGERYSESYRCVTAYLEAGYTYILETPKSAAPMQAAAYGPGKQPQLNTAPMASLSLTAGSPVKIAHTYDTAYFKFTPPSTNTYRFTSSSPVEGSAKVDSYAFLLDSKGYALASDDDVNYDAGQAQFDFSARLDAGVTYVLAVRAYVLPGQLSSSNPSLDFNVTAKAEGAPAQTQAVSGITAGDGAAIALFDDDGNPSDGIGAGGRLEGWGTGLDTEHDIITGFAFGEGQHYIRRTVPQLLYLPDGGTVIKVWRVGQAYVAKGSGRSYYAWGVSDTGAEYGYIKRLDNARNGLAQYDISCFIQGGPQGGIYFLDAQSGKVYSMDSLATVPKALAAPEGIVKLAATDGSLFALDGGGTLYAMGTNRYGECGTGGVNPVDGFTAVALPGGVMDFAAGSNHIVALLGQGSVFAWGCNDGGELGLGSLDRIVSTPSEVSFGSLLGAGESITTVFAGFGSSAALTSSGRALVWGANDFGQLGIGDAFSRAAPVEAQALSQSETGLGKVAEIAFGPESGYAVTADGSVFVSGRNEYNQLGFVSGEINTFTRLSRPDLRSGNNKLLSLALSAGKLSPAFSPETYEYDVELPEGTAMSIVKAIKADATAVMTMDGRQAASETVNAGPGQVRAEIRVTAQNGDVQAYVLNFPQNSSSDAFLSTLSISGGGVLASPLNHTAAGYSVVIPETVSGPVTIAPGIEDPNSTFVIDGTPGLTSRTVKLSGGATSVMTVKVTAQLGNTRTYTFAIARKPLLASCAASPVYAGYPSLSPGGSDRLVFRYSLNAPATVKLQVKKGSRWVTVLSKTDSTAGAKSWAWDGKVSGSALSPGTYAVRLVPYSAGIAGTARTLTVKMVARPHISLTSLYPSTFTANGVKAQKVAFLWTQLSDVRAEIVTLSGAVVRTLYTAANCAPGSRTIYWNGRSNSGALLKPGYYRVKITCGGKSIYRKFKITK